ncbi:MAG: MBL fold metallo-hydrolase [Phycisphaerales bacterium JB037]
MDGTIGDSPANPGSNPSGDSAGMDPGPAAIEASLCVLASGSTGNCSVLRVRSGGVARSLLIDAGLSPRRTRSLLDEVGVAPDEIRGLLLTHLDRDHWHTGWERPAAGDFPVFLHERHARIARRTLGSRATAFAGAFEPIGGVRIEPHLVAHDELGTAAFRVEAPGGTMGFATDLGRATDELVEHLSGVDVLALESNYCPRMQRASGRPEFLQRRIMGGSGHLSNHEAAAVIERALPREHVVFLHLSRECNDPAIVASLHAGADYAFTIAAPDRPTRWVPIVSTRPAPVRVPETLFESLLAGDRPA